MIDDIVVLTEEILTDNGSKLAGTLGVIASIDSSCVKWCWSESSKSIGMCSLIFFDGCVGPACCDDYD